MIETRSEFAGVSVGDYAVFADGSTADAYDTSLTKSTPTGLSVPRGNLAGASVGNYALFAGGFMYIDDSYRYYSTVDAYTVA